MNAPTLSQSRELYDRVAPFLVILIGIAAATGIWVGATAAIGNARQDEADTKLLACLNNYATLNSESAGAIRNAAAAVDLQRDEFYVALNYEGQQFLDFVNKLYKGQVETPQDLEPLRESLSDRARAASDLEIAQNNLDQVRKDNPVPPAPKVFCELEGSEDSAE